MLVPNRHASTPAYRYGFNGKEKDDELKGEGNSLDFGARMLDPRIGRWFATDALESKYPEMSPYAFTANNPVFFIDPDGKIIMIHYLDEKGNSQYYQYKPGIKPTTTDKYVQQVHEAITAIMKNDANKTFQQISDSKETVTFNKITEGQPYTDGKKNKESITIDNVNINWNPLEARVNTDGSAVTPATRLLHEGAHALRDINVNTVSEYNELMIDLKPNGNNFHTPEEQRVIEEVETPYINATNSNQPVSKDFTPQKEGTRKNHYTSDTYITKGVNSLTPADGSKQKGQRERIKPVNKNVKPTPKS